MCKLSRPVKQVYNANRINISEYVTIKEYVNFVAVSLFALVLEILGYCNKYGNYFSMYVTDYKS